MLPSEDFSLVVEKAKEARTYVQFIGVSVVMEGGLLGGGYMILGKTVGEHLIPSEAGLGKAFLEVTVLKLKMGITWVKGERMKNMAGTETSTSQGWGQGA